MVILNNPTLREQLIDDLRNHIVYLIFEKKDGSTRQMVATLDQSIIQRLETNEERENREAQARNRQNRATSDKIIPLFDIEQRGFRSFRIANVFAANSPQAQRYVPEEIMQNAQHGLAWFLLPLNADIQPLVNGEIAIGQFIQRHYGLTPSETTPVSEKVNEINQHVRHLIHLMTTQETVDILFKKSDGSIREMTASRNVSIEPRFEQLNTPNEIERQIASGKIPLYDVVEKQAKSFLVERLLSYVNEHGEIVNVGELHQALQQELEQSSSQFPYAPAQYSIAEMVDILRSNVVRVKFTKTGSGGGERLMFATRNPNLIRTYEKIGHIPKEVEDTKSEEEKLQEMETKRLITVFDLDEQEFRSIPVDGIHPFDVVGNVPSWLEYDAEVGDWYAVLKGHKPVQETYTGSGFSTKPMTIIDKNRMKFEIRQQAYLIRKAEVIHTQVDSDWKQRLQVSEQFLKNAIAKVEQQPYTSQDLETFEVFSQFAKKVEEDWSSKVNGFAENTNLVLSEVKVYQRNKLVRITYNWGRDVFYFHPRFIVNATSHKIYADRTNEFQYTRAKISDADRYYAPIMEKLAPLVTGRRKADLFTKPLDELDIRRFNRIIQLTKQYKPQLDELKIKINRVKDFPTQFKVTVDGKQLFLMNPEYVYDLVNKGFLFIRTPEHTLQVGIEAITNRTSNEKVKFILNDILLQACDLRRTVKSDDGKDM